MSDRIRFITHQGKQILLVDLSNCSATQADEICHMVPPFVTGSDFGGFHRGEVRQEGLHDAERSNGF